MVAPANQRSAVLAPPNRPLARLGSLARRRLTPGQWIDHAGSVRQHGNEAGSFRRKGLPYQPLRTDRPRVCTADVLDEQAKRPTVLPGVEHDMPAVRQPGSPLKRADCWSPWRVVEAGSRELSGVAGAGWQDSQAEVI